MSSCLCELYVCVCGFAHVYTLCVPFVWDYASCYIIHVHNGQLNKCPFIQPLNILPALHIACCTYWSGNMINEPVSKFIFKISLDDRWVHSTGVGAHWFYDWQLAINIIWTCCSFCACSMQLRNSEKQSKVMISDMMWAKLQSSTN